MFLSNLLTGRGRRVSRRTGHSGSPHGRSLSPRRLRCEPLEERQLMSVFTYTNDPIPDQPIPDKGTITSAITVDDSYYAADVNVTVNMSHTRDEDLDVFLIAPDGTRVELFTDVGGTADNFTGTTLDADAATAITAGSAPFSGTYRPEGNLSTLERKSVQGTWKLEVTDDTRKETGTLNSWSLTVTEAIGVSTRFLDTNPEMLGNVDSPGGLTCNDVAVSENGDAMALWLESKGTGDTGPFMTMAARFDAATGKWETPEIIGNPALTTSVQNWGRIASDGQGNYLAVWQQPTIGDNMARIWANRYLAGSGWQTPQTIENDTYWSYDPVVAMAYDPIAAVSKAIVAWGYGPGPGIPAEVKVNRLTDFAANTWSGAALAGNLEIDIRPDTIQVGMAANGDFLLAFQDNTAYSEPFGRRLYYRHYQWSAGDWSGPESPLESRPESITRYNRLAMNAAGDAIVSWGQGTGTGGLSQMWVRRWSGSDSDWVGPAELVSDDPGNTVGWGPSVAISDNGETAVFYAQAREGTQYRDAYVRRHDGAGWQGIVKVDSEDLGDVFLGSTNGCSKGPAGIAMDDSGNIIAAWQQSDGVFTNIWSAKFDHSASSGVGEWSPAAKLEDAPWNATQPVVAVSGSGMATTVWVQPDNTLYHVYADRTTVNGSSPLANAPVADAGGPYLVVEGGSVTLDASGTTDPDAGDILAYEWDLNYDGVVFNVDAIGQTTTFDTTGLLAGDVVTVAVRATDSTLPVALWDIDTTTVTVQAATSSISYDYTGLPVTIGDLKTVTTTINVPDTNPITEIQVRLNLTHANPADLTAWLVSPNGITMTINGPIVSGSQAYDVTYPSGMDVGNLEPLGTWTLSVRDGVRNSKRGTFTDWSLLVTPAPVSANSMPRSAATDVDQALLSWLEPDSSDEEETDLLPQPAATDLALMMME